MTNDPHGRSSEEWAILCLDKSWYGSWSCRPSIIDLIIWLVTCKISALSKAQLQHSLRSFLFVSKNSWQSCLLWLAIWRIFLSSMRPTLRVLIVSPYQLIYFVVTHPHTLPFDNYMICVLNRCCQSRGKKHYTCIIIHLAKPTWRKFGICSENRTLLNMFKLFILNISYLIWTLAISKLCIRLCLFDYKTLQVDGIYALNIHSADCWQLILAESD